MSTRVAKWGNSLGVRLPSHVARMLGLAVGDTVFIRVDTTTRECIMVPAKKDKVNNMYFSPTLNGTPPVKTSPNDHERSFLVSPVRW
jgi:antitoxin component of MazEF toxin-antitoxin module